MVDGLPLVQVEGEGAFAEDTTLVCPLIRDGAAKPRVATMSGACLEVSRGATQNS